MKFLTKALFVTAASFSAFTQANYCDNSDMTAIVGDETYVKFHKGSSAALTSYGGNSFWQNGSVKLSKGTVTLKKNGVSSGSKSPFYYTFTQAGTYSASYKHELCWGTHTNPYMCVPQVNCSRKINVISRTKPSVSYRSHSGWSNTHSMDSNFTTTFKITDTGKDLRSIKIFRDSRVVRNCGVSTSSTVNTCSYTFYKSGMSAKQYRFSVQAIDKLGDSTSSTFYVTMKESNKKPTVTLSVNNTAGASSVGSASTIDVKLGTNVSIVVNGSDTNSSSANQLKDLELNVGNGWKGAKTFFGSNIHAYNNACSIGGNSAKCAIPLKINADTTIQARARDKQDSLSAIKAVKVNGVLPPVPNIRVSNSAPFVGDSITITATINSTTDLDKFYLCAFNVTNVNADNGCSSPIKTCSKSSTTCTHRVSSSSAGVRTYTVYAANKLNVKKGNKVTVNFKNHHGIVFTNPKQKKYNIGDKVTFRAKASSLGAQSTTITKLELFEGSEITGRKLTSVTVSPRLPIGLAKEQSQAKNVTVEWVTSAADIGSNKTYTLVATDNKNNKARTSLTGVTIIDPVPHTPKIAQITVLKDEANNGKYHATIAGMSNTRRLNYSVYVGGKEVLKKNNIAVTQLNYSFTIDTKVEDHGKELLVEAVAQNYNDSDPSKVVLGLVKSSNRINIENYEMAPHSPVFDNLPSQVGGSYTLKWKANTDGVTNQYQIHTWPGLPSDKNNSTAKKLQLSSNQATSVQINNLNLGRHTYQVTACNSQSKCIAGQQITIEHIAPFFSSGDIQNCSVDALNSGKTAFTLSAKGVGFSSSKSTVHIRLRKTGETFPVTAVVSGNSLSAQVNDRICRGYLNGGLALTIANGVKDNSKWLRDTIVIDKTGSEERPELANHEYTVSDNHYLYVGQKDGLKSYKLNTSSGLTYVWSHKFEAALSNEVVAKPLVTSKNAADEIYVGSLNKRFYKLTHDPLQAEPNKRKITNWVLQTQGPIRAQAAIDEQQNLYVGSMDEALYSVDTETGNVQWHYEFPGSGGIILQPTVSASGHIYVTTEDGELHVIDNRMIGANAIKWQDISSLANVYAAELQAWELAQWQPDQSHTEVIGLAKAMYVLLQRSPTKNELSFLAFLLAHDHPYNEIINAIINANPDLANASDVSFINHLFNYLLGSASSNDVLDGGALGSGNQAYWVSVLESGVTRADVTIALLGHARTQYEGAVNSLLYYFYDYCLDTKSCVYDFDTDGDGLSDRAEDELGTNPVDPSDGLVAPVITVVDNGNGNVRIDVTTTGRVSEYQLYEQHDPEAYHLGQQFAADTAAENNLTTLYKQFGNGIYHFKVKACISVSTQYNGTRLQCSNDYSNEVQLKVESSAVESPISVKLPNTQASKHSLSQYALRNHAQLQPTAGNFRVTESGAAAYSIPIALPAGITGVQPDVSLNYSSQSSDGPVALGWSLAASSSISRCRQTQAQDGQFKGITLTDEDRYCIDGQRLVSTNVRTSSGHFDGATVEEEYVTEIDSQISVLRVTQGGNTWFVVKGKDGSIKQYGLTALSRVSITNSEGNESTISWLISKVEDNKRKEATTINYIYTDAVGTSELGASERVLSAIEYSGNRVEFNYSVGEVRSVAYIDQAIMQQRARLSDIVVKNHLGEELSTYELSFKAANNGMRLLEQVQQCRGNVCRKPITFEYDSFATNLNFEAESRVMSVGTVQWGQEFQKMAAVTLADLQGDGKPELVTLVRANKDAKSYKLCVYQGNTYKRPEELSCRYLSRKDDHESVVMFAIDPDQDGKQSLVINLRSEHTDDYRAKFWTMYSLNSTDTLFEHSLPTGWLSNQYMREIKPADLNGDGYVDLVFKQKRDNANLYVKVWNPSSNSFGGTTTLTTTSSNIRFDSRGDFTEKGTDWQVMDLNFDGLADIISLRCDNSNKCDDYEAKRITVHYNQGSDANGSYNKFSAHNVATAGKIEKLTPTDINGDGLVDIIYLASDWYNKDMKRWKVLLNTSSSEVAFSPIFSLTAHSDKHSSGTVSEHIPPMLIDIDKNGKVDLFFKHGIYSTWSQYEWSPEQRDFEEVSNNAFTASLNHEKGHYAFFADYNNDGVPDILIKNEQGVQVKYNLAQSPTEGFLTGITQGFGNKTSINYALMTNPEVYSDLEDDLTKDAEQFAKDGLQVTKIVGASPLVRSVVSDSPSSSDDTARSKVEYHYQGARVQFGGRGMLGFKALTTKMTKKGTSDLADTIFTSTTRYHQAFPLTGMPYSTEKRMGADNVLLSVAKNFYGIKATTQQVSGNQSYQVFNEQARECSALVNSNLNVGIHNCTDVQTAQDKYANVTSLMVDTHEIAASNVLDFIENGTSAVAAKSVLTINTYGSSTFEQKYGRLERSTVTTSVPNSPSITRTAEFTYYPADHASRHMLHTEVSGKGLGCEFEVTTEHSYDSVGNKVQSAITASACTGDKKETRYSRYEFDNEGRYSNFSEQWSSKQPSLKMRSPVVLTRNAYGLPITLKDVNGVTIENSYDQFGGEVGQYASSGAQSFRYMSYCSDGSHCSAQWNKEVNGELVAVDYLDRLGRIYRSSKVDVTGQWLSTDVKFDIYGQNVETTAAGSQSVTTQYDALGRVTSITDPNTGTVTITSTEGLHTSTTISGSGIVDQVKSSTKNILGQVVSSTENGGPEVKFTYYADGSKKDVRSYAESVNEQLIMELSYDALGRKQSQKDADRGDWTYSYNAFGELISQTDARGVVLTTSYDGFGRKIKQTQTTPNGSVVNEGSSEWHYGTSFEDVHLLLAVNQDNDWQQNYYYDTFGRSAAVLTSLDGINHCESKVAFNTISNDLRIVDTALKDPLTSKCVIQQTAYDEYGRVALRFDDYRRLSGGSSEYIEARGVALEYAYNQVIAKTEAREGRQGQNYYRIIDTNDRGQVVEYQKGNVTMAVGYDAKGTVSSIFSKSHAYIQSDSYSFDSVGNLVARSQLGMSERTYHYDSLNRVLGVNNVDLFKYSASGNLEEKADYRIHETAQCSGSNVEIIAKWDQNYGENSEPLHAITSRNKLSGNECSSASGPSNNQGGFAQIDFDAISQTQNDETFTYDANGNETSVTEGTLSIRSIKYSARNKAIEIRGKDEIVTFSYDVNNRRYKRAEASKTIYYVGALQLSIPHGASSEQVINRYIGNDAQQTYYGTGQSKTKWMFTDHQGSTIAITNSEYKLLKRYAYDIFGKQSEVVETQAEIDANYADEATLTIFDSVSSNFKAYTGHEPVSLNSEKRVLHMNGRMYDTQTGRFMQADPFVQAPLNLQNYNAYSYVLNNPLSYTDPSGYLFKKIGNFLKKNWRVIAAAVATYFTAGWAAGLAKSWVATMGLTVQATAAGLGTVTAISTTGAVVAGAITGAISGAVGGYIASGSGKGAWKGALSGAVFGAIGKGMTTAEITNTAAQMGIHAVAGGVLADIQGGNFGHGFVSAGIMKGVGKFTINNIQNGSVATVIQAIAGGTVSKLTGGKFANGAMTSAIQFVVNEMMNSTKTRWRNTKESCFSDCMVVTNHDGSKMWIPKSAYKTWLKNSADERLAHQSGVKDIGEYNTTTADEAANGLMIVSGGLGVSAVGLRIVAAAFRSKGILMVSTVTGDAALGASTVSLAADLSDGAVRESIAVGALYNGVVKGTSYISSQFSYVGDAIGAVNTISDYVTKK
ncbi:FG-GAP-like repeat-containing protein [Pseudoalteromonas luteoviolacea]|uniref:FG-GAP-like repeat-containing protein n=1 Tax=Pseudoalteromonas luteoviolacea TaxID=43657 RepID=UPI00114DB148|nr:FG-GAP-like repeat-containing protein [Pseudoalteromonas luteoviolacea]TQF67808.1 PQQ-binding-like beta-propeller repeat protein [Pseudoalteromonas luteoviolacea]